MNNKAINDFGFRRIWRIKQILGGVIHRGRKISNKSKWRCLNFLMGKAFVKINVTLRLLLVSSVYLIRSMMQWCTLHQHCKYTNFVYSSWLTKRRWSAINDRCFFFFFFKEQLHITNRKSIYLHSRSRCTWTDLDTAQNICLPAGWWTRRAAAVKFTLSK